MIILWILFWLIGWIIMYIMLSKLIMYMIINKYPNSRKSWDDEYELMVSVLACSSWIGILLCANYVLFHILFIFYTIAITKLKSHESKFSVKRKY